MEVAWKATTRDKICMARLIQTATNGFTAALDSMVLAKRLAVFKQTLHVTLRMCANVLLHLSDINLPNFTFPLFLLCFALLFPARWMRVWTATCDWKDTKKMMENVAKCDSFVEAKVRIRICIPGKYTFLYASCEFTKHPVSPSTFTGKLFLKQKKI